MNHTIFMDMNEVKEVLGISQAGAYRIIKRMNEEMEAAGFLTVRGLVNRKFFQDKLYINSFDLNSTENDTSNTEKHDRRQK